MESSFHPTTAYYVRFFQAQVFLHDSRSFTRLPSHEARPHNTVEWGKVMREKEKEMQAAFRKKQIFLKPHHKFDILHPVMLIDLDSVPRPLSSLKRTSDEDRRNRPFRPNEDVAIMNQFVAPSIRKETLVLLIELRSAPRQLESVLSVGVVKVILFDHTYPIRHTC